MGVGDSWATLSHGSGLGGESGGARMAVGAAEQGSHGAPGEGGLIRGPGARRLTRGLEGMAHRGQQGEGGLAHTGPGCRPTRGRDRSQDLATRALLMTL